MLQRACVVHGNELGGVNGTGSNIRVRENGKQVMQYLIKDGKNVVVTVSKDGLYINEYKKSGIIEKLKGGYENGKESNRNFG